MLPEICSVSVRTCVCLRACVVCVCVGGENCHLLYLKCFVALYLILYQN